MESMVSLKLGLKKTVARGRPVPAVTNSAWENKFIAAWSRSDALFRIVEDEDILTRPIVWRHPFGFYIGHLPAFSWNQICGGILNWKSLNPYFDDIFCRGIDPDVDTGTCHWHPDAPPQWPSLREIVSYRNHVRRAILESIDAVPPHRGGDIMTRGGRVFQMILEHEYMHQETLLYMMQELSPAKKRRPIGVAPYSFQKPS